MSYQKLQQQMVGVTLVMLLLIGCGAPPASPVSEAPVATSTPVPQTPTPTPVLSTATPAPITPTVTSPPEWDYVALGDSIVALGDSYAVPYAAHIEADLGVKVKLYNRGVSGMMSGELLGKLRSDQYLRDIISEAEVVTIVIGTNDLFWPLVFPDVRGDCDGADTTDCVRDALESFRVNYDAIIAELFTLCSSKMIIRTMTYQPGSLGEFGFDGDLRPFYGPLNDHIIQASSENNIPVALVHLAFNGPDGDEDPADKGYLASDGLHTSKVGAAVIADLHQELGYEYTCP